MRPRTNFPQMVSKWLATLTELARGGENACEELTQSAYIILLMHEGMTVEELAAQFNMSKTRIITLRQRFMILGPHGLQRPAPSVYGSYLRLSRPDEGFGIRPFPRPRRRH
jgi:hypothetical protein